MGRLETPSVEVAELFSWQPGELKSCAHNRRDLPRFVVIAMPPDYPLFATENIAFYTSVFVTLPKSFGLLSLTGRAFGTQITLHSHVWVRRRHFKSGVASIQPDSGRWCSPLPSNDEAHERGGAPGHPV